MTWLSVHYVAMSTLNSLQCDELCMCEGEEEVKIEITRPQVQPVYVNSGGMLDLICELDHPYQLQWHRALVRDTSLSVDDKPAVYEFIDTSSVDGFFMTARITKDARGWTQLIKYNISVADTGSYKCSRTNDPRTSYAVDVNVLQGQFPLSQTVFILVFLQKNTFLLVFVL